tara:strand:- start:4880 stop:5113 length:234 start_codon:yes stop_codon:yes gene_type:complete
MPKVKLSEGEIQGFIDDVAKVLNSVPLFYVYEVLERANEDRQRDGELSDLDISDSEDEEYQSSSSSEEEEEEEEEEE